MKISFDEREGKGTMNMERRAALKKIGLGGAALLLSKVKDTRTDATGANLPDENECTPETPLRYPSWLGLFTSFFGFGVILAVFPLAATGDFGLTKKLLVSFNASVYRLVLAFGKLHALPHSGLSQDNRAPFAES